MNPVEPPRRPLTPTQEAIIAPLRLKYPKLTDEQIMAGVDRGQCLKNFRWLVERHRYVKDKSGVIRKLGRMKLAQRKTAATLAYLRANKMLCRVIIAKSRKQGISTYIAADCYEQVKKNQLDALILSHDRASVVKIFKIYDRFYERDDLPKPARYKGKVNLRELRFEGHDGHITVETANNIYAGTGETPQYCHLSECSKWDRGAETKTALLQAIGDNVGTTLIEESTFNGEEDCFLPTWRAAYDNSRLTFTENKDAEFGLDVHFEITDPTNWNGYAPLFISVLDDEDARIPFGSEDEKTRFLGTLDADEKLYMERYGASAESLNWLRRTLKLKCRNRKDIRRQEYPVTEGEAILASGRPRFNIEVLNRMPLEDGKQGRLERSNDWDKSIKWVPDPQGFLTIFRHPQPGHDYIIGCDPAEGSSLEEDAPGDSSGEDRLDASVIEVFDMTAGHEEAAVYHSIETPEDLAIPVCMLGHYFNDAYIVIEANSSGYTTCIKVSEQYDNTLLYHRDDWDPQNSRHQRAVGHKTTTSNRNIVIAYIADALNQNDIILHSRKTVAEHKSFVYNKRGKPCASFGKHDDHVSATWLARAGIYMARRIFETRQKFMLERPGMGRTFSSLSPRAREAWATRNIHTGY